MNMISRPPVPGLPCKPAKWRMQVPAWLVAALYLSLPNLLPLLSTRTLGTLPRGFINLECLLIGAFSVLLPRGAVFLLLWLGLLADFALGVCNGFGFSAQDLLSALRFVPSLPASRLFEGLAFVALGTLLCAALALVQPPPKQKGWTAVALLGCAIVLVSVDILGGQSTFWHTDAALVFYRAERSPVATLAYREIVFRQREMKSRSGKDAPVDSASSRAVSFLANPRGAMQPPNVVLVVVESWGVPLDSRLSQALTAPFDDPRIALKYNVSAGAVPFTGHTVPGEARELCQSTIGFGILHASPELVKHCLPAFFHARDYQNFAVHGFQGQMFSRSSWYPRLGFDRSWFGPELHRMGLPNCIGSWTGVCDSSIAGWIGSELLSKDEDKPKFIYWMTLNSHLLEPEHPDLPDDGVCATQSALENSVALCSWFRLVRAVHQSVAQMALIPMARPTVFILVGDHAPPFGDPKLGAEFSSTQVPYEMLTPVAVSTR